MDYLNDVSISAALVGLTVLRILQKYLVHIGAGILYIRKSVTQEQEPYLDWSKKKIFPKQFKQEHLFSNMICRRLFKLFTRKCIKM